MLNFIFYYFVQFNLLTSYNHPKSLNMKNLQFAFLLLFFATFNAFTQKQIDVDGVIVPRIIKFENRDLQLNGIGIRTKLWFDVYTQALYLSKLSQDPVEVLESNTTMAIRIQITSSLVTSKKFSKLLSKGFLKSNGEVEFAKHKKSIDLIEKYINNEKIVEKDIFNLVYNITDESLWVIKNDALKGKIPGKEFKKAFFGIWLSEKPIDEKLKNDLLGKS